MDKKEAIEKLKRDMEKRLQNLSPYEENEEPEILVLDKDIGFNYISTSGTYKHPNVDNRIRPE